MKKIIGIFAAVLLLGSVAVQAGLFFVSIPFNTSEYLSPAEFDQYEFIAPTSGTYSFYTTGTTDTVGEIWVNDGIGWWMLDSNDDGADDGLTGYGLNFCVDGYLFAGEYASIDIHGFAGDTGAYTVYGQQGPCVNQAVAGSDSGSLGLLSIFASFMVLMVARLRKRV